MGNTASEQLVEDDSSVDTILARLPYQSADLISSCLRARHEFVNRRQLLELATKVYNLALSDPNYCYLAEKLCDITIHESNQQVTFRDVFVDLAINKFEDLRLGDVKMLSDYEKSRMADFYGILFLCKVVSSAMVRHWITSLDHMPKEQQIILMMIKDRVVKNFCEAKAPDLSLRSLRELLAERKLCAPIVAAPTTSNTLVILMFSVFKRC